MVCKCIEITQPAEQEIIGRFTAYSLKEGPMVDRKSGFRRNACGLTTEYSFTARLPGW